MVPYSDSVPGLSIEATRAARQIIDACRHGDPEVTLTPAARLAVLLKAVIQARCPGPGVQQLAAAVRSRGRRRRSAVRVAKRICIAPSPVTRLSDRASLENNQVPQGS